MSSDGWWHGEGVLDIDQGGNASVRDALTLDNLELEEGRDAANNVVKDRIRGCSTRWYLKQGVVSSRRYLANRLLGDVLVTPQVGFVAALPRMKTCPGWMD